MVLDAEHAKKNKQEVKLKVVIMQRFERQLLLNNCTPQVEHFRIQLDLFHISVWKVASTQPMKNGGPLDLKVIRQTSCLP